MKKITLCITLLLAFFYATLSLAQSSPKKGVKPPADFWEFQQMIQSEYSNGYYAEKFRERKQKREQISQELLPESSLAEDTVFALTVMGQYTNLSGNYTQAEFQSLLYDGPNPTGTVTEYYSEVSYNQLFFTGDAKGWYDMPRTLEEYEGGNSGLGPQGGPRFVWEIMQVSDSTLNYADYIQYYDGQGRPHIGFLAVIHSGADASAGAFNIWAHRWDFTVFSGQSYTTNDIDPVSGQNVIIDGPYAIMSELSGSDNNSGPIATIGVFAHEFGHIFGVPDLYDTDGSSSGIGEWCLMASGSWGGDGSSPETPVHMSAWIKKELGWVTPINITSYQGPLSIPNVEENPIVYRMWQGGTITNQYFLIENRQRLGFDANIHKSGFLIYHIDDNLSGNQNEDHRMVDIEQADGLRNLNVGSSNRGDAGDPFPGSTQNTRFDFYTNPNSQDYTLQNTFVSVRNIYEDGNMMVGDLEIGPRPGVNAFGDPITSDFGTVEVGTNSNIKTVILTNFGDQDLEITAIPSSVGDFNLVTPLTFPITLSTYDDSLSLEFTFSPTVVGDAQEIFTVSSNDPVFTGFTLLGHGFVVNQALDRVMYASSGAQNDGNILTINKVTGEGTNVGLSSFFNISGLTISPLDKKLYAVTSAPLESEILKVNSLQGDSYIFYTFDLPNMTAIAFDTSGTLYGALETGDIYSIDLTNGTYQYVSTAQIELTAITFEPITNDLWATIKGGFGEPKDGIYKIDLPTGDITTVGETGFNVATNDLAFDENGVLYGIKGTGSQMSDLFIIDVNTGEGIIIGSVGLQALTGLAFAETGVVNDVQEDENNKTVPTDFALSQNYPNPFNPSTSIDFSVPANADVTLTIYNLLGQVVTTLVNEEVNAGHYSTVWNGSNDNGFQVSSGVYLYEMKANGINGKAYSQIKKMVFLK